MQKWEYLFVECGDGKPRWVNGSELPNWKKTNLADWSNQRGDEGWELVTSNVVAWDRRQLVYKRPKA